MRRITLITLTCLTVLTGAMWIVSYIWIMSAVLPTPAADGVISVELTAGRVTLLISRYSPPLHDRGPAFAVSAVSETREKIEMVRSIGIPMDQLENRRRFEWSTFAFPPHKGVTWNGHTIAFPHWLLLVLFGAWPALAAACRMRRRLRANICRSCGYDLRASPPGVCPECGAANPQVPFLGGLAD